MMKSIQSRYSGTCLACGGTIAAGAQALWDPLTGATIHASCAREGEDPRVTAARAVRRRVVEELRADRDRREFSNPDAAARYDAAVEHLKNIRQVEFWLRAGVMLARGKITPGALLMEATRVVKGGRSVILESLGAKAKACPAFSA